MSSELTCILIAKMYIRLNRLIEKYNYDLQNEEVQRYSRRLDKVIARYSNAVRQEKQLLNAPYSACGSTE
jgi:hypothetical protein